MLYLCISLFTNKRTKFFSLLRRKIGVCLDTLKYWDDLNKTYDQLKDLTCPEESHLSKENANYFTRELVKIMLEDGAITNLKTN